MERGEGAGGPLTAAAAGGVTVSDNDTLARVRGGDPDAYDTLFARHVGGARRVARSMLRDPVAAEDAVAEAFAQTLAAIRRGRGPVDGFDAYLLRSVRHECFRTWQRQARVAPGVEPSPTPSEDGLDELVDIDVMRSAFRTLPSRMRLVLWRTEVEGRSHAEIAEQLHTSAPAVATLAVRARRQLAAAYLQGHADGAAEPGCATVRRDLAAVVRGTASAKVRAATDDHLAGCEACRAAHDDLVVVNERLRTAPLGGALASIGGAGPIGIGAKVLSLLAGTSAGLAPVAGVLTLSLIAAEPVAADHVERDGLAVALDLPAPPPISTRTLADGPVADDVAVHVDLAAEPVPVVTLPARAPHAPVVTDTPPGREAVPAAPAAGATLAPSAAPAAPGGVGLPEGPEVVDLPLVADLVGPVVGTVDAVVAPVVAPVGAVVDDVVAPVVDDVVAPVVDDVVGPVVGDVVAPVVGDVVGPVVTLLPPLLPGG